MIGGFGTPDSYGYVYATLAADQTVDVTPKARVDYYTGGAGGTEVKVRIFDANTGAELTDQTTTVIVGQQISLYCTVSAPSPVQPTAYQWNVPGFAISNYVVTSSSATVYSNFPTTLTNVTFYWVDGVTNRVLTCSATVHGQKAVGQATFNIYRPSVSFTDLPPSWATNYRGFLSIGDGNNHGEMSFEVDVSTRYSGRTDLTQLINRSAANGNTSDTTGGQYWLDNARFYITRGNDPDQNAFIVKPPNPKPLLLNDSPSFALAHSLFNSITSIFDQFQDYIMFRPDAGNKGNNIYVPLGKMAWKWSASTTYSGGSWSVPTYSVTRPRSPDASYEFPQWPNVYQNN